MHRTDGRADHSPSSERESLNFDIIPERLKKFLLDLEGNYKILEKNPSGIFLKIEQLEKFENLIYSNYNEKEVKFLKFIFTILKQRKWLPYRALCNHLNYFFPEEIQDSSISSAEKKTKKNDKLSGTSGDLLDSPTEMGSRKVEDDDLERVKNIPLRELENAIKEPIDALEVFISPETIFHATSLTCDFSIKDELNELYDKIIDHFAPEWNKQGWAWLTLYTDKKYKIKAHFTIRMHENGRFIIPTKRGMNLKEFFMEMNKVFSFLSVKEFELLISSFSLTEGNKEHPFLHLANKIDPDEVVEEKLNKAKVRLKFIDHLGTRDVVVKIDKSTGSYEVEIEGRLPESLNLNSFLSVPSIATGTLRGMHDILLENRDNGYSLKEGQTTIYKEVQNNGSTLLLLDKKLDTQQEESTKFFTLVGNSFKMGLETISLLNKNTGLVGKSIGHLYNFVDEGFNDLKEDTFNQITPIIESLSDNSNKLVKTHKKIDELQENITTQFKSLKSDLKELIKEEFKSFRKSYVNNLYLVLKCIREIPNITVSEMQKSLNISRSTLYNYLNKLEKQDIIKTEKIRKSKKGRSAKAYTISDKTKNLINKIIKKR